MRMPCGAPPLTLFLAILTISTPSAQYSFVNPAFSCNSHPRHCSHNKGPAASLSRDRFGIIRANNLKGHTAGPILLGMMEGRNEFSGPGDHSSPKAMSSSLSELKQEEAVRPDRPLEFVVQKANALNGALAQETGMTFEDAAFLVSLGAVFVYKEGFGWERAWRQGSIEKGTKLRAYTRPRRFPACDVDWSKRVLHADGMYVVVNKPADLPCQAVESNGRETAPACAERALGLGRLRLAHRIDSCAEGALVLARSAAALGDFTRMMSDHERMLKLYRAVVSGPVEEGLHIHFLNEGDPRGPRLVRREPMPGWKNCSLQILSCTQLKDVPIQKPTSAESTPEASLYEVVVRLLTGRRHQIRAQLSALGAPIWGDSLYQPMSGLTLDLEKLDEAEAIFVEEQLDSALEACMAPSGRIALQCWKMQFEGVSADAGPAWWMST